jgi:sugar-specific transcriptional regulator TrmB
LSAVSLGPISILKLAQNSQVKRTTVYSVAENLIKQGLMRKKIKGFKTFFVAENPEKLKTILENKEIIFKNYY